MRDLPRVVRAIEGDLEVTDDGDELGVVGPRAYVVLDIDLPCNFRVLTRHTWSADGARWADEDVAEAS